MTHSQFWTQRRTDELVRLWPDHRAQVIADWLGCSKNAVIGKAHRMGLLVIEHKERRRRISEGEQFSWSDPQRRSARLRSLWATLAAMREAAP